MTATLKYIVVILFACINLSALAAEQGTAEEAKALVAKAIESMKKQGIENTIADINKKDGGYQDRDLYVVVYDLNAKNLAQINPKMIGKNMIDLKDADGKYFIRERIEIANKKGSGWQDYKFVNPVTKQIEPKSMYIEKYETVIVGCGFYKKN
ncbi:cache domain-containing protein [Undibacterium jejuense]|uniref:Cache domain-containing protein n=1 Tax=Undibacterium jejuense TaxID=1344949 RepID=A0A923HHR7_9BURK|nr:cache domain-containing protein [Undibacterium jejuense]MBC3862653.1 cache domain-containing protein [Undibacterium jejuense]